MQPLFNVERNDQLVLVALPKHCKISKPVINLITYREEVKSATVFMPIIECLPWIYQVLQDRCMSAVTTNIETQPQYWLYRYKNLVLYPRNKNIESKQFNLSWKIGIKLHKYCINKHMDNVFGLHIFPCSSPTNVYFYDYLCVVRMLWVYVCEWTER